MQFLGQSGDINTDVTSSKIIDDHLDQAQDDADDRHEDVRKLASLHKLDKEVSARLDAANESKEKANITYRAANDHIGKLEDQLRTINDQVVEDVEDPVTDVTAPK